MVKFAAIIPSVLTLVVSVTTALGIDYYDETCPNVDEVVGKAVKSAMSNDVTVPAALLRMHFHDCFIKGCDGSILLNSTKTNKAEKDGPPNISLHAFYVIDRAKEALESLCPGVVSCADILALAARDSVALSGGPTWDVPKGRKDGRVSMANDTITLPFPFFNFTQLTQSFSQRGLSGHDLIALSGSHTIGFAHCSSFQNRIYNFSPTQDVDPSLDSGFAASLRSICKRYNKVKNAGSGMDSTVIKFDNVYYKMLLQGKALFSSDHSILTDRESNKLVSRFASSEEKFNRAFVKSMIKMSSIAGAGREVRSDCKLVR